MSVSDLTLNDLATLVSSESCSFNCKAQPRSKSFDDYPSNTVLILPAPNSLISTLLHFTCEHNGISQDAENGLSEIASARVELSDSSIGLADVV